jgi:glucosamine-phosphate N-acetyltransferase
MEFCNISKDNYKEYINLINSNISKKDYDYFIDNILNVNHLIILLKYDNNIIVTGTLLIEEKLTYGGCKMGHIENILVDPDHKNKGFGEQIVNKLLNIAKNKKCYRVDLNCNNELEKFYKKKGFKQKHICMNLYFKENFN